MMRTVRSKFCADAEPAVPRMARPAASASARRLVIMVGPPPDESLRFRPSSGGLMRTVRRTPIRLQVQDGIDRCAASIDRDYCPGAMSLARLAGLTSDGRLIQGETR